MSTTTQDIHPDIAAVLDGSRRWCVVAGDCLDVLPMIPSGIVDMLWTDPPYGHGNADGDLISRRGLAMGDGKDMKQTPIANDRHDTMRTVVDGMLGEAVRILKRDCCCCCCCCGGGGPSPTFAWVANRMDAEGLAFFHSVIWDKKNPGMGWRYRRQHEMIMVAHRRGGKLAWAEGAKAHPNIISISKPRGGAHPNEKPVALVERFIGLHTNLDALVVDPFTGSGTTGVAAIRTGRRFIGIEIDEHYASIARERIAKAEAELAPKAAA